MVRGPRFRATGGVCFYPALVFQGNLLLTETLFTFLLCLFCLLVERGLADQKKGMDPTCSNGPQGAGHQRGLSPFSGPMGWLLAGGAVLGLAALTRNVLWLFPPFLLVFVFWATGKTGTGTQRPRGSRSPFSALVRRVALSLAPVLAFCLVIAPWALRNTLLHKTFTTIVKFLNFWQLDRAVVAGLAQGFWGNQPRTAVLGIGVLMAGSYSSLDRRALAIQSDADLERWAFEHLRAYMLDGVDGPLLAGKTRADLDGLARESLRECLNATAGGMPPLQRIWHLFLSQRSRRETALALVKFHSLVEIRLPYLDNDLVDLLLAALPEMKRSETIQGHILGERRPEFLDVVNVNTGTRIGAGPLARKFAGLKGKVLAKLRVKGYQPYERLGLWLRRELRPLVCEILLSGRCLERGIFAPDTVRRCSGSTWRTRAITPSY